ncbi:hypothetical protein ABPG72_012094 [Tetrahymena utriculariae]
MEEELDSKQLIQNSFSQISYHLSKIMKILNDNKQLLTDKEIFLIISHKWDDVYFQLVELQHQNKLDIFQQEIVVAQQVKQNQLAKKIQNAQLEKQQKDNAYLIDCSIKCKINDMIKSSCCIENCIESVEYDAY